MANKNFAYSLVATAPSPATSGTSLVVTAADGTKFPATPFRATIWPAGVQPTAANAEVVTVTGISTDTLTIVRTQESSSARTVIVGDQIAASITGATTPILVPVATAVDTVAMTEAATANPALVGFSAVGSDSNIHFQAIGKGNGLTKCSVLRQDDTSNTYKHNTVNLTGWGVLTISTAANNWSETVTFGITFAQRPIVLISPGGDALTATGASYGNGTNAVTGAWSAKAHTITTTSFTAHMHTSAGTNAGANGFVFYQWQSTGEL